MEENRKGEKLEQCALCGKHLKNETNLLNHVIQVHGKSEEEINTLHYQIDVAPRVFISESKWAKIG